MMFRCENCYLMVEDTLLREIDTEQRCPACIAPWYVLMVNEREETSVAKEIKRQAVINDLGSRLHRVLVLRHKEQRETRKGTWVNEYVPTFPGYVILQMDFDGDLFHMIRDIRNVIGLVPHHESPTALKTLEAIRLLLLSEKREQEEPSPSFVIGDKVKVTGGTFKGLSGKITKVTPSAITVVAFLMGRDVPIFTSPQYLEK